MKYYIFLVSMYTDEYRLVRKCTGVAYLTPVLYNYESYMRFDIVPENELVAYREDMLHMKFKEIGGV